MQCAAFVKFIWPPGLASLMISRMCLLTGTATLPLTTSVVVIGEKVEFMIHKIFDIVHY